MTTTIAYADCPSGASGDMILAAFLDLGLPLAHLEEELGKLGLPPFKLSTWTETRAGLVGRRFQVQAATPEDHPRSLSDIRMLLSRSTLSAAVKDRAGLIFENLGRVEGRVHGVDPAQVHFHEIGALDSIVDVVGAAVAWEYFGLARLEASPLPLGSGWAQTAHGRLPLPAPATLGLLEGVPTYGTGLKAELVTPTGAAILVSLAAKFGPWPAMTIRGTGLGCGTRDLPDRPNILRLVLGRAEASAGRENLVVGQTNVDDMNPEFFPHLLERLLEAGALDAWLTPIQMKKGRPGVQLSFLARPGQVQTLVQLVFSESTTLGLRTYAVERLALARETRTIQTPWGQVALKVIQRGERTELVPEFEACREIARRTGRPLKEIYAEIIALAKGPPGGLPPK